MIILAPYARFITNGKQHPKNYPWWDQVVAGIDEDVLQVGIDGEAEIAGVKEFKKNLRLYELARLVDECKTWLSVDSFLQHYAWDRNKFGIAIFGQSDPVIFGHPENTNLLKDRGYLREKQFWLWEQCDYREDCWISPAEVLEALKTYGVSVK